MALLILSVIVNTLVLSLSKIKARIGKKIFLDQSEQEFIRNGWAMWVYKNIIPYPGMKELVHMPQAN